MRHRVCRATSVWDHPTLAEPPATPYLCHQHQRHRFLPIFISFALSRLPVHDQCGPALSASRWGIRQPSIRPGTPSAAVGKRLWTIFTIHTDGSAFHEHLKKKLLISSTRGRRLIRTPADEQCHLRTHQRPAPIPPARFFKCEPRWLGLHGTYYFPIPCTSGSAIPMHRVPSHGPGWRCPGSTLYGVTPTGGRGGSGTIYALVLAGGVPGYRSPPRIINGKPCWC